MGGGVKIISKVTKSPTEVRRIQGWPKRKAIPRGVFQRTAQPICFLFASAERLSLYLELKVMLICWHKINNSTAQIHLELTENFVKNYTLKAVVSGGG